MTTPLVDPCGCSHAAAAPEQQRRNLPGLSRLSYRVGTHTSITRAMQDALAKYPALRALTTRDNSDPTIAVLDAFAVMGDVLTFYQERIANEGYLRTATERRSILELAREIGYELKPGVAAGTYLTFIMDAAKGAPPRATIAAGSKVQSVPGQDEKPQIFETAETIEARVEWNALKAKSSEMVAPASGDTHVYFKGTDISLQAGDVLIFVGMLRRQDPSSEQWDLRRVRSVDVDTEEKRTHVELQEPLNVRIIPTAQTEVHVLRQRAALFGYNAPNWRAMPKNVKNAYLDLGENDATPIRNEWPNFTIAAVSDLASGNADESGLVAEYYNGRDFLEHVLTRVDTTVNFNWGTGSPDVRVHADEFSVRWRGWVRATTTGVYSFQTTSDDGVRLWVNDVSVINNWTEHGSQVDSGAIHLNAGQRYRLLLEYFEKGGAALISLSWKPPNTANYVVIPATNLSYAPEIHLDGLHPSVTTQSWIALATPRYTELYQVETAAEDARANFTLSGKSTRLNLSGENLFQQFNNKLREATVYIESERLTVAERPITTPIAGTTLTLATRVDGLAKGRPVEISGKLASDGSERREIAIIGDILQADTTTLRFSGLAYSYRPDSVTVNANLAQATHGEAKFEVLGSGDATRPFQRFVLKQQPVTYVSAATARGAASTLDVRVNDVRWHEVDTLHERGPDERVFVTRRSDEGAMTVQFGDGVSGARPASGADNVTAAYRIGIGLAGRVKAGQLSLLMTRPPGVREARNALDATGGADRASRDDARANAPLTVLTLDRVVSLQDYEDYARAFAGIGKARATWLWDGEKRFVHVTVAGAAGADVPPTSTLYQDLVKSLDAAREPTRRVSVQSYVPLPFYISAAVAVDVDYVKENVHAAVRAALANAFSFARRSFGAPVSKAEVLATIQRVPGVIAADLNTLDTQQPGSLHAVLFAPDAAWTGQGNPPTTAASLLLLADGGVALTDMAP